MASSGAPRARCRPLCALFVVVSIVGGCPAPEPFYDDDIGEEGVPVEDGALAGTWATKSLNATLVDVPALGRQEIGGGINLRLVHRTYDAENAVYTQSSRLCGGYNFEVLGVTTRVEQSVYRSVPESTEETVVVDHATGRFEMSGHLQLWALRDLPEPYTTPLPADAEAAGMAPHTERIFDVDEDGAPGFTTYVEGAVVGEQYVAQRKTLGLLGVTRSADRVFGLAQNAQEVVFLGNNNALLDRADEGSAEPYPDPKEAWFDMVRVEEDVTCDDIVELDNDGTLARLRPFGRE